MVIEIELSRGMVAIIDDEDYDLVSQNKWCVTKNNYGSGLHTWYATRKSNDRSHNEYMHRIIMGVVDSRQWVDHVDGNGLNNRRENLRLASATQNHANSRLTSSSRTGYKGVTYREYKRGITYVAQIKYDRVTHFIGHFDTAIEAARAYDELARSDAFFGPFARLNFPIKESDHGR